VRFPEDKIKEAILHPDPEIRARAIHYFSNSYSANPSIMIQVIKALETYGREDAWRLVGPSRELRQTDESVDWVIKELNDERSKDYESYVFNVSMVLLEADPALLLPREKAILEARHFLPSLHPAFTERLSMLSWDAATCWRELEAICETEEGDDSTERFDLARAKRIVEALARHGTECEEKVHTLLGGRREDGDQGATGWLEPLVVRLAGEARLQSTIPLLINHLRADLGDLDNEQCGEALAKIGTPAVLHAVAEAFPGSEHHFSLYSTKPLETIHSDLAVETCFGLLEAERDEDIQVQLAHAALAHYAEEAIEPARRLLLDREIDLGNRDLLDSLLNYCTLTGARFPEYDEWLAEEKRQKEQHQRIMKELEGDPMRQMLYAFGKLAGKKDAELTEVLSAPPLPSVARPSLPAARPSPPAAPRARQKIGRNERCPCGSGKKFKHCCGRQAGRGSTVGGSNPSP
jgi:hypothetical protein